MVVTLKFYGDLKEKIKYKMSPTGVPTILEIENKDIKNVADILKKFSIEESVTSHIFVNCRYSGLGKKVKDGDKIAIFPRKMGLLYKWYFTREENDV